MMVKKDDGDGSAWCDSAFSYIQDFLDDDELDGFILRLIRLSKRRELKREMKKDEDDL